MASSDSQQTWFPYEINKDCSFGYCSPPCLQWCNTAFPPPPPFRFPNEDDSIANVSPLVIAIIGILSGAFLLVFYYLIVSRCCRNFDSLRRRSQSSPNEEFDEVGSPPVHEPWQIRTAGLDESVVKSIAVCKYKRGDGLVEGTDCLVCLNEFKEDEYLRLLPKCNHAFHIPCIDTWLKSHTNCPLCRASIVSTSPPLQLPAPVSETLPDHGSLTERRYNDDVLVPVEDLERGGDEVNVPNGTISKPPFRAFSDLGRLEERDSIIEITDEEIGPIRRSFSMDSVNQGHPSITNILGMNAENGFQATVLRFPAYIRYLRRFHLKSNNRRVLHCVISPIAMKRSSSSGRLFFNGLGRGRNAVIPI